VQAHLIQVLRQAVQRGGEVVRGVWFSRGGGFTQEVDGLRGRIRVTGGAAQLVQRAGEAADPAVLGMGVSARQRDGLGGVGHRILDGAYVETRSDPSPESVRAHRVAAAACLADRRRVGDRLRCSAQLKAPTPVMSRPTMRVWTVSVPSNV
jgi:hypothetical protein